MAADVVPRSLMRIVRWRSRHLVPSDHPAPDRVRARIDDALRHDLADALANVAAQAGDDPDELVFVRRLELDVAIDAAWDRATIAQACAVALGRGLHRELSAGSTDNVIRFRTRAEYVAAYVTARALGDAPLPWFLDGFRGWSYLPASSAIRAALCDMPAIGAAALPLLPVPALTALALTLDASDVEAIVGALPAPGPAGDLREAVRAVLAASADAPPPLHVVDRPGLVVWLAGRTADRASWAVRRATARLITVLVNGSGRSVPLAAALAAAASDERVLDAAVASSDDQIDRAVRLASAVAHLLDDAAATSEPTARTTRFGGPFLLVDDLLSLRLDEATADWPAPGGMSSASNALGFVLLGFCLGTTRADAFVADPVWRDLFGIPPHVTRDTLARWLDDLGARGAATLQDAVRSTDPALEGANVAAAESAWPDAPAAWRPALTAAVTAIINRFACRLPGFADSTAPFLRRNFLDVAASLDFEPGRIVVTLTRPPLALVLALTGRSRGERRWPCLDARPFVLFTEG